MFKKCKHILSNQRGLSLVEILVAVGMLGGLSIAVVNMTKQQAKLSTQSQLDGDISEASARILNALNSPKYCDNNFKGKSLIGTIPVSPGLLVIGGAIIPQTSPDWNQSATAGNITNRLRMNSASYRVEGTTFSTRSLAILNLTVQFETTALENKRKTITKDFTATVIVNNGPTIIGCPRTWNSTIGYSDPP